MSYQWETWQAQGGGRSGMATEGDGLGALHWV